MTQSTVEENSHSLNHNFITSDTKLTTETTNTNIIHSNSKIDSENEANLKGILKSNSEEDSNALNISKNITENIESQIYNDYVKNDK